MQDTDSHTGRGVVHCASEHAGTLLAHRASVKYNVLDIGTLFGCDK